MRKKMGLTSIFKVITDHNPSRSSSSSTSPTTSPSSWAWPSCKHPKTLSFRVAGGDHEDVVYKIVNSVYFDTGDEQIIQTVLEEQEEEEMIKDLDDDGSEEECLENIVVHGLRSDRLFFEPGGDSKSILQVLESTAATEEEPEPTTEEVTSTEEETTPFKESVAEEMESENPYMDFRLSMEEMVKAHGLNNWDCLEELLGWYLRMNGKKTHVFILGAFVDLLLDLASPSPSSSPSFCSSTSSTSSSCFCTCSSPTTTTTSSSSVKFVSKNQNDDQKEVIKKKNQEEEEEEDLGRV